MEFKEELHWEKTRKAGEIRAILIVSMIFLGLIGYLTLLFQGLAKIDSAVKLLTSTFGG